MKMVTIAPVALPKSFSGLKFTKPEWASAKKRGDITLPFASAVDNIRLSKGIYEMVPETKPIEVVIPDLPDVADMDGPALAQEMGRFGKPPTKKMKLSVAREFVQKLRDTAAEMIEDD